MAARFGKFATKGPTLFHMEFRVFGNGQSHARHPAINRGRLEHISDFHSRFQHPLVRWTGMAYSIICCRLSGVPVLKNTV